MACPALFGRPITPAERMRRYRARKGRRYRGEPLMDLAGLSERSRSYAAVLKRFAVPEPLALLRAEQPLGLRTAAEIARRLNGTGQRRLARIYRTEGKVEALAIWARLRHAPSYIARRPSEKRSPMEWMPLARRRLGPVVPDG